MATQEQETARSNNQRQQGSIGGWLFSGYADIEEDHKKRPCSRGGNREAMANKNKHQSSLGGLFGGPDVAPVSPRQHSEANGDATSPPPPEPAPVTSRSAPEDRPAAGVGASPRGKKNAGTFSLSSDFADVHVSEAGQGGRTGIQNEDRPAAGVGVSPRSKKNVGTFSLTSDVADMHVSEAFQGGRIKNEARNYARRNWGTDVISHQAYQPHDEPHHEEHAQPESRVESAMSEASTVLPVSPEPATPAPEEEPPAPPTPYAEEVTAVTPEAEPAPEPQEDLKIDVAEASSTPPASGRSPRPKWGNDSMSGIFGGGDSVDYGSPRGVTTATDHNTPRTDRSERNRNAMANRGTAGSIIYGGGYA